MLSLGPCSFSPRRARAKAKRPRRKSGIWQRDLWPWIMDLFPRRSLCVIFGSVRHTAKSIVLALAHPESVRRPHTQKAHVTSGAWRGASAAKLLTNRPRSPLAGGSARRTDDWRASIKRPPQHRDRRGSKKTGKGRGCRDPACVCMSCGVVQAQRCVLAKCVGG